MWQYNIVIVIVAPLFTAAQLSDDPDELLNWCLDSKTHKTRPGPEDSLYSQCTPWKERSCCTFNVSKDVHYSNLYNFDYNHCGHIKNMSNDCQRHFKQDLCFYECSPNIGPWTVKVSSKTRKERFHKVPLCESDCQSWFTACIDDYTCTDNWVRNWDWTSTGNKCLPFTQCNTFKEIFGNASNFCAKIWDDSWESTPDDKPCMRLWFNETRNPNDNIAKLKVRQLMQPNRSPSIGFTATTILIVSLITICL